MNPAHATPRPVVLCILDGWGHRSETDHNAILAARTPHWDALLKHYPHGLINASELHVGLPEGQMGNSEVGHMHIGSGRLIMQDLPLIDRAIKEGTLAENPNLVAFVAKLKASGGACHLAGLLSPGGVHSHQHHIESLAVILAQQGLTVYIHAFLDGRDTPPQSAVDYVAKLEKTIAGYPSIHLATLCGRYYAMDRDNRWERVQLAHELLVSAKGTPAQDATTAIKASYERNKSDEFLLPVILGYYPGMKEGDGLLMANFRSDRAREIITSLVDPGFTIFPRLQAPRFAATLGMAEYSREINHWMPALFPPKPLTHLLGEVVAAAGKTQLRIAETEKYAHVTFFFNGGREQEYEGEIRILVPSPKVATYDLKPEMSAFEVTDKLVKAIRDGAFDLIVVNYANTDMVGHTGDLHAATRAVEAVDICLGRVTEAVEQSGGALLVTADHGNAEMMRDSTTNQAHTAHTLNLVPVVIASAELKSRKLSLREGSLADIAPTILDLMQLEKPAEMTGQSLLGGAGASQYHVA